MSEIIDKAISSIPEVFVFRYLKYLFLGRWIKAVTNSGVTCGMCKRCV
jgi:hypothetical protein